MNERIFGIELKVTYQRADGVSAGEISVSAEGGTPEGSVALSVMQMLAKASAQISDRIADDLNEATPQEQVLTMLAHRVAHHDDRRAAELLAALNAVGGDRLPEAMPAGTAPSIEQLNEMFRRAGYGSDDLNTD